MRAVESTDVPAMIRPAGPRAGQSTPRVKLVAVVGARPNFVKMAALLRALSSTSTAVAIDVVLVHTGQHYDVAMNTQFFAQLGIPEPDICLQAGSGSHAVQTATIMLRFERVLDQVAPDCILLVGDVNSTIACALVAAKKQIKVVHVEAGLRSGDRAMPEELNRLLTDQLSDRLYVTEPAACLNLRREGIPDDRVVFSGNVMIDTLLTHRDRAVPAAQTLAAAGAGPLAEAGYAVVTLHRPSNVDDGGALSRLVQVLDQIAHDIPLVFPVHPRTRQALQAAGLQGFLDQPDVVALAPLGYFEMLGLMADATFVLTDSGGIQEETTALGVPCLTVRENTERPVTIEQGTNTLTGTDARVIRQCVRDILETGGKRGRVPEKWDGHAAERIVADLSRWLCAGGGSR
ncbi:non-hydrolyzing UDP-N-acetylglucosamine 2-epimerase [Tahibacter amnicola]|uniref:UDP-N-acetylglucosamine 2-epimerase (Non-hydrolyzing) n=1 Tax=Tahibacter amnicola TaxID=2976241 RepID=A0ABY6BB75_9GAMM|nr:UDP-N-acetylglucosamine 2-epimerase (non-hydrolyzing) [Tahibacter amnicola]UXI66395.1 UDP-N-acetylglucosamine 2-epimerase (non-hydrolyzing) [Tahibacter amnicola]